MDANQCAQEAQEDISTWRGLSFTPQTTEISRKVGHEVAIDSF
jgi:hypothetical protein